MLPKPAYTITEVTDPHSPYLPEMNAWMEQIFPESARPASIASCLRCAGQTGGTGFR